MCFTTFRVWVQALEHDLGGVDLELADGRGGVDDLALQVAGVDGVEVDQADRADASGGQVHRERSAQAAGADAQHLRGFQLLLALHADLGQDQVPGVARDLFVGKLRQCGLFYCGWHCRFPSSID